MKGRDCMLVCDCVRTDFQKLEGDDYKAETKDPAKGHISVSPSMNALSIRDMESGVMLTVSLDYAMEAIARSLEEDKEKE